MLMRDLLPGQPRQRTFDRPQKIQACRRHDGFHFNKRCDRSKLPQLFDSFNSGRREHRRGLRAKVGQAFYCVAAWFVLATQVKPRKQQDHLPRNSKIRPLEPIEAQERPCARWRQPLLRQVLSGSRKSRC